MVSTLPQPAQRLLLHATEPGVPLWRSAQLQMRGEIRLGRWRRFTARQVLTPAVGLVWAATARFFGLPVSGYDRYSPGTGEMRWRLARVIPVLTATGPDVTRSAAGRLAAGAMFVPATFDLAPGRTARRLRWLAAPGGRATTRTRWTCTSPLTAPCVR